MIPRHLQIAFTLLLLGVFGAGIYMNYLRQVEQRAAHRAANARPISAPVTGPKATIHLAIAYDDDEVMREREFSAALPLDPGARTREVLRTLLNEYVRRPSPHPLAEGADVRDVYVVNGGLCVVDVNAAFADGHRSGVLVEELTMASMVESIGLNVPEVKSVKFLVEGKERETLAGHADLSFSYDVATIHQLVTQLR